MVRGVARISVVEQSRIPAASRCIEGIKKSIVEEVAIESVLVISTSSSETELMLDFGLNVRGTYYIIALALTSLIAR